MIALIIRERCVPFDKLISCMHFKVMVFQTARLNNQTRADRSFLKTYVIKLLISIFFVLSFLASFNNSKYLHSFVHFFRTTLKLRHLKYSA